MKNTFEWAGRLLWIALLTLSTLPVHAKLMLAHYGDHSGGSGSKTGACSVACSGYEMPKGELTPTHAFCDHVPEASELHMTVDLTDPDSREMPIAVRLVMERHGEGGHEILSLPAKAYPSGSITFE